MSFIFFLFLALNMAAYLYLSMERGLAAKTQQRIGISRSGFGGTYQVLLDFIKQMSKRRAETRGKESIFFIFAIFLGLALPYLFCFILFSFTQEARLLYEKVLSLYSILLFAIMIDSLFLFYFKNKDVFIFSQRLGLSRVFGIALYIPSTLPALLYLNNKSNEVIFSPFSVLSFLCGFLSLFFIVPSSPFIDGSGRKFNGMWDGIYHLSTILWIINLAALLVILHINIIFPIYTIKGLSVFFLVLVSTLFAFLWIQNSFPFMRTKDAWEFGFKKILPAIFLAFVGELFWLVFYLGA